jgi:hypothetical protein
VSKSTGSRIRIRCTAEKYTDCTITAYVELHKYKTLCLCLYMSPSTAPQCSSNDRNNLYLLIFIIFYFDTALRSGRTSRFCNYCKYTPPSLFPIPCLGGIKKNKNNSVMEGICFSVGGKMEEFLLLGRVKDRVYTDTSTS